MKCKSLVYRELRGKKYPKLKVISILTEDYQKNHTHYPYPIEKYEPCNGNLKLRLELDSDGCSCSTYLKVNFDCTECGCSSYNSSLPNDTSSLEEFVNNILDEMDR